MRVPMPANDPKRVSPIILSIILSIFIVSGYSTLPTAAQSVAAPAMPAHWKITSDVSFSAADIEPVAARLGGAIAALRNPSTTWRGSEFN
jgi:hypothetical protein